MSLELLLLARAPVGGNFLLDVLPGMLALGVGAAFGFMAVILASTAGVPEHEAGLASGLVNTSQQMGGALGLAALAAVATLVGAVCVVVGAVAALALLRLPRGEGTQRSGPREDQQGNAEHEG